MSAEELPVRAYIGYSVRLRDALKNLSWNRYRQFPAHPKLMGLRVRLYAQVGLCANQVRNALDCGPVED